jgi:hypothetical protein
MDWAISTVARVSAGAHPMDHVIRLAPTMAIALRTDDHQHSIVQPKPSCQPLWYVTPQFIQTSLTPYVQMR